VRVIIQKIVLKIQKFKIKISKNCFKNSKISKNCFKNSKIQNKNFKKLKVKLKNKL